MRQLSAILFLAILLFNFYGYSLVIDCMQNRQSAILESKLDKQQYNDDELISIKTPLNLPYYTSSPTYERAYGSLEVNGTVYEYVKRRVNHDTLELLCLPNKAKTNFRSVKNEFVKFATDATSSQQDKKSNVFKISFPDFYQDIDVYALNEAQKTSTKYFFFNTAFLQADYSLKGEQPPELIS